MGSLRKTTKGFIEKARKAHGDRYDYSKVVWKGWNEKVTIICPVHGEFEQNARGHYDSGYGCKRCSMKESAKTRKSTAFTLQDFLDRATSIHGDKFDYSKVEYKNSTTKVTIGCPIHGWSEIKPKHHYKGTGCYGCGREKFSKTVSKYKSIEQLMEDLKVLPENKYTYDNVKLPKRGYFKTYDKITVTCPHHGDFKQSVYAHLAGHGCNECRFFGYSRGAFTSYCREFGRGKAKVYLLHFSDEYEEFYKIGLTARTVKQRFRKESDRLGYKIEKVSIGEYAPSIAWDKENTLKQKYSKYSYVPQRKMPGFSECFTLDLPVEEVIDYLKSHKI